MPNPLNDAGPARGRRSLWAAAAVTLFGIVAIPVGLTLQAIAWSCENSCPGDSTIALVKLLTGAGFVSLIGGVLALFVLAALREPRHDDDPGTDKNRPAH